MAKDRGFMTDDTTPQVQLPELLPDLSLAGMWLLAKLRHSRIDRAARFRRQELPKSHLFNIQQFFLCI